MTADQSPTGPLPELGSNIGCLRESLAAIRNLEKLLGSMSAGPKLLTSLLPEVRQTTSHVMSRIVALLRYVSARRKLGEELWPVEEFALRMTETLDNALDEASHGPLLARRRLKLESTVRRLAPELAALIEHIELLVESAHGEGVSLSLAELFSSRPAHSSSTPYRELVVVGPADELQVVLPPRVSLGAMSILAQTSVPGGAATLSVTRPSEDVAELLFLPRGSATKLGGSQQVCRIPGAAVIEPSLTVARLVLEGFGARFVQLSPTRLLLPATTSEHANENPGLSSQIVPAKPSV